MRFWKIRSCRVVAWSSLLTALMCAGQVSPGASEKKASYSIIQVPGSAGTYPMALNDSMAVTGYYLVSPTVARGFIQDGSGAITTFSVPNSQWTEPESINAAGDVTGFFAGAVSVPQGFLRYADGRLVTFNPPAERVNLPQALPVAINDFDDIAGNYPYPAVESAGFTRSRAGELNGFTYSQGAAYPTVVTSLNGSGTVTGYFYGGNPYSSFVLHPDGFMVRFDVPLQQAFLCAETTIASSVNAEGVIAGWYSGGAPSAPGGTCAEQQMFAGGFVRSPQGAFTLFQAPGPIVTSPLASAMFVSNASFSAPNRLAINVEGTVTGSYTDAGQAQHGFVRETDGVITSFDPPSGMQTTATGINASGVIVGSFYYNWNAQASVGFLRVPLP